MPIDQIDRQKLSGTSLSDAHARDFVDKVDSVITQVNTNTGGISTNSGDILTLTSGLSEVSDNATFSLVGFTNPANSPDSEISFDRVNRRFTIQPTGASFKYWCDGTEYTATGAKTVDITDDEGPHFIYFDGDTLKSTQTFTTDLILSHSIVSIVLWEKANAKETGWSEERHGRVMSPETHLSRHLSPGTVFVSGGDITHGAVPTGAPSNDQASKVYVAGCTIRDEDISITSVNAASPSDRWEQILGSNLTTDAAKLPVIHLEGATGFWRKWENDSDRYAFHHNGGNTPPYWNEFTGGAWQLTACANRDFVVYYVCQWNDYHFPVFLMMGQNTYDTLDEAMAASATDLDWGVYHPAEIIVLHRLIFEYRTTYTSATHRSALRHVESYNIAGTTKVALVNANQNHAALQNLSYEASGHTGFTRTAYFTTSDPTTDNDITDTADIGRSFEAGEFWYNSSGVKLWFCADSSAGAAVWKQIQLL